MCTIEIKNNTDLEKALSRLDEIWSAKPGDMDWEERCDLVDKIEEYEDRTVEISPPSPLDAILFRMEQGDLRNKDLIPFIGSAPKVSEVLSGKRSLSKDMIRRLNEGLGIPLKSLLGVADNAPEGYVQVEWVLPAGVVRNVADAAAASSISVEDWVTRRLTIQVSTSGDMNAIAMSDSKMDTQKNTVCPETTSPEAA